MFVSYVFCLVKYLLQTLLEYFLKDPQSSVGSSIVHFPITLTQGGYGLENTYEDVRSSDILEDILTAYVESVNKEPEEVGKPNSNKSLTRCQ